MEGNRNGGLLQSLLFSGGNSGGGGGGGGALELVEFSYDGETVTCNKTFSEVANMTLPIGVLNGQGLSGLALQSSPRGQTLKGAFIVTKVGNLNSNHCVTIIFKEDGTINAVAQELAYNS